MGYDAYSSSFFREDRDHKIGRRLFFSIAINNRVRARRKKKAFKNWSPRCCETYLYRGIHTRSIPMFSQRSYILRARERHADVSINPFENLSRVWKAFRLYYFVSFFLRLCYSEVYTVIYYCSSRLDDIPFTGYLLLRGTTRNCLFEVYITVSTTTECVRANQLQL